MQNVNLCGGGSRKGWGHLRTQCKFGENIADRGRSTPNDLKLISFKFLSDIFGLYQMTYNLCYHNSDCKYTIPLKLTVLVYKLSSLRTLYSKFISCFTPSLLLLNSYRFSTKKIRLIPKFHYLKLTFVRNTNIYLHITPSHL